MRTSPNMYSAYYERKQEKKKLNSEPNTTLVLMNRYQWNMKLARSFSTVEVFQTL